MSFRDMNIMQRSDEKTGNYTPCTRKAINMEEDGGGQNILQYLIYGFTFLLMLLQLQPGHTTEVRYEM